MTTFGAEAGASSAIAVTVDRPSADMLTDPAPFADVPSDGEPSRIGLPPETTATVVNRLRRAQGQIGGVLRIIEEGQGCAEIVTQMAAVSRAVDRAGFALIAAGLKQCLINSDGRDTPDTASLEKLFLSLA